MPALPTSPSSAADTSALLLAAQYRWDIWARPTQLPPHGDWSTWLALAGRGWGKTRTGVEWVRAQVETGACKRMALVAPTAADVRDVLVEGESGILATAPPWCRPSYEPSKRRLTWPNGAIATTYSADEPDRLRGPQHDGALCDELAAWRYPEAWDQLQMGLRLPGGVPRCVVTTTPRPTPLIRDLVADPGTVVTRGSTYENEANLAPAYLAKIKRRYEGTRLGRQELHAEILDDMPGALWSRDLIEQHRVTVAPTFVRVVVAVDPAVTAGESADETGIVVAALGQDGHAYVLEDVSLRDTPERWAQAVVSAAARHQADRVVAEGNQGGDLVELTLRAVSNSPLSFKKVHASRGKQARAEPVSALYEQGRVHHLGLFGPLEDQLCQWVPGTGSSPDRLDALVWAITELMVDGLGVPTAPISLNVGGSQWAL